MKRMLAIVLLCALSAPAQFTVPMRTGATAGTAPPPAGFSVVHEYAVTATSGATPITVDITATTAGNALLIFLDSSNNLDYTITGTPTQWYKGYPTSGTPIQVYYSLNISGGTTSLTFTRPSTDVTTGKILEVSGVATSNATDVYSAPVRNSYGTGNATAFTGSITTTNASDVIFGIGAFNVAALTYTAGTGYTLLTTVTNGNYTMAVEYKTVSSTGTYNPGLTYVSNRQITTSTAAFKLQ